MKWQLIAQFLYNIILSGLLNLHNDTFYSCNEMVENIENGTLPKSKLLLYFPIYLTTVPIVQRVIEVGENLKEIFLSYQCQ